MRIATIKSVISLLLNHFPGGDVTLVNHISRHCCLKVRDIRDIISLSTEVVL